MGSYSQNIKLIEAERGTTIPHVVFGQGDIGKRNDFFINLIQKGDIIFTTVWFLRNIDDSKRVLNYAKNGLIFDHFENFEDREGKWNMGRWETTSHKILCFKDVVDNKEIWEWMSSKYILGQFIWKIKRGDKIIYQTK